MNEINQYCFQRAHCSISYHFEPNGTKLETISRHKKIQQKHTKHVKVTCYVTYFYIFSPFFLKQRPNQNTLMLYLLHWHERKLTAAFMSTNLLKKMSFNYKPQSVRRTKPYNEENNRNIKQSGYTARHSSSRWLAVPKQKYLASLFRKLARFKRKINILCNYS